MDGFDINPSVDKQEMSLLVDYDSNEKSLDLAIRVSEEFGYSQDKASVLAMKAASSVVENVYFLSKKYGISASDHNRIIGAFSESFRVIGRNI